MRRNGFATKRRTFQLRFLSLCRADLLRYSQIPPTTAMKRIMPVLNLTEAKRNTTGFAPGATDLVSGTFGNPIVTRPLPDPPDGVFGQQSKGDIAKAAKV
jgi:hypothetical protein